MDSGRNNASLDTSYTNRQTAFQTTVAFADKPEQRPVWKDQDPKIFTARFGQARTLTDALVKFTKDLGSDLTGAREDKETIQKELADATILLGNACGEWFGDQGSAGDQAQVTFTASGLTSARDQVPADAATVVIQKADAILAAPVPPAPALSPADYGITPGAVEALTELLADYRLVLTRPSGARKARKGKREQLPARFAEIDAVLGSCDNFVIQFRGKETDLPDVRAAKNAFVDGWFASRRIDDLGGGKGPAPKPAPGGTPPAK